MLFIKALLLILALVAVYFAVRIIIITASGERSKGNLHGKNSDLEE